MSQPNNQTPRRSFGYTPRSEAGPQLDAEPGEPEPPPLPPDAVVDLAAARNEAGVDEVLARLDAELVGLEPVKTRIAEIAALLLVDQMRARF
ncbi:MAG: CbbX protein, partial [Mycobacterium sp.]